MALRFLDHADRELARGRRLQASEKIWGAVAQQLSAIAEQRGWGHEHHHEYSDMIRYLAKEYNQPDLPDRLKIAEWYHANFYQNTAHTTEIRKGIADARQLVADLEDLRQRPMRPVTIENGSDRAVIYNLTGVTHKVGTKSEDGFTNERLTRLRSRWGQRSDDSKEEGAGQPNPAALRQPAGPHRRHLYRPSRMTWLVSCLGATPAPGRVEADHRSDVAARHGTVRISPPCTTVNPSFFLSVRGLVRMSEDARRSPVSMICIPPLAQPARR